MPQDSHPAIKHLEDRLGTNDPFTLDQVALRNFTAYDPIARQEIIETTDAAISADDGVSLRQKSQLLAFNRKLKTANALLKRSGR